MVRCCGDGADEEKRMRLCAFWKACRKALFSLEPGERQVGWPSQGQCSYYEATVTEAEARAVNAFCTGLGAPMSLQEVNTRLWKQVGDDGTTRLV